jgi:hypothetical protein
LISFSLSLPLALEQNGFKRFNALLQPGQALVDFLIFGISATGTVSRPLNTTIATTIAAMSVNQDQRPSTTMLTPAYFIYKVPRVTFPSSFVW